MLDREVDQVRSERQVGGPRRPKLPSDCPPKIGAQNERYDDDHGEPSRRAKYLRAGQRGRSHQKRSPNGGGDQEIGSKPPESGLQQPRRYKRRQAKPGSETTEQYD